MVDNPRLRLTKIEQRICDAASEQLNIPRSRISPSDRLLEDLHCDSLDLVELFADPVGALVLFELFPEFPIR